jgi:hypothetical protein
MPAKKTTKPKRAYTKGGQPFTAADLRALEFVIDYAAYVDSEQDSNIVAARQALRNARELRTYLLRHGHHGFFADGATR